MMQPQRPAVAHLARVEALDPRTQLVCRAVSEALDLDGETVALLRLVATLSRITSHSHGPLRADAAEVDDVFDDSEVVARAAAVLPTAPGERWRRSQHWIRAVRAAGGSALPPAPVRSAMRMPLRGSAVVKPLTSCLFTSSSTASSLGMWHLYLAHAGPGGLLRLPTTAHRMVPRNDVRVAVVDSAVAWVRLVAAHGSSDHGVVLPDWSRLADEYDAVHLTCEAVARIQGVALLDGDVTVPPSYWDVETTVWLRWCFTEIEEIALNEPGRHIAEPDESDPDELADG